MKDGTISYAIVSFGSTAGIGGKQFAVDWKNLTLNHAAKAGDMTFSLEVAKTEFDTDPGFEERHAARWPRQEVRQADQDGLSRVDGG